MPPIAKLTIKNYRCFEDTFPLVIDLDNKVMALVGANNSGKSALLRFFFELKNLWLNLTTTPHILEMIQERKVETGVIGATESASLFHRFNERPMSFSFEFPEEGPPQRKGTRDGTTNRILGITFTAQRGVSLQRGLTNLALTCELRFRDQVHRLPENAAANIDDDGVLFVSGGDKPRDLADLSPLIRLGRFLHNAKYFPATRHALTAGGGDYDATLGGDVAVRWADWKAGTVAQRQAIERTTRDIERLLGVSRLEINAVKDKRVFTVTIDGEPFDLSELGAGTAQLVVTLANVAMTNPSVVLMDEPELSLHASLQAAFVNHIARYTQGSMIFSTHSVGLARTTADRPIYSFRREGTRTVVKELSETRGFAQFLGELSFASFNEVGFDKMLLVEGVNDVRTVMALLDLLGNRKRLVVLPLGGAALASSRREEELAQLLDIVAADRIAVLVDSERTSASDPPIAERVTFEQSCKSLRFAVHLTERRAIENYLTDAAVKAEKGDKARAFGPYETFDKKNPVGWGKNEGYRIAQKMSRSEIESTDLGRFLASI